MKFARRHLLRGLAGAALCAFAPDGARAQPAETRPRRISWLVAGPDGSPTDRLARLVAPRLIATLHGPLDLQIEDVGGEDGVSAANQFVARGLPDGMAALMVPAASALAWLIGDARARYDARNWVPVMSWAGTSVLFGRNEGGFDTIAGLARPRPGASARIGAPGVDSPELAALLALNLLGIETRTTLGLKPPNDPARAFAAGSVDLLLVTRGTDLAAASARPGADRGVPLMTLGGVDEAGALQRDPAMPDLPHLGEVHQSVRGAALPQGPALNAFRAALAAGIGLQYGIYLPRSTPADIIAQWRQGAARVAQDAEVQSAATAAGLRILPGTVAGAHVRALAASPADIQWLRDWLARTYNFRP
ncbi:MAG: hypothetical protein IT557_13655 [Alphaproteobacteria bacterium]|nr:hypothetical protein [Alphaproteobacteria bacterium]